MGVGLGRGKGQGGTARSQIGLALALMALLALFVILQGEPEAPRPYTLTSTTDDGLLALRLWLTELDYAVSTNDGPRFTLPASTRLFFVYPTVYRYTPEEAQQLATWVQAGNTLVLVGPGAEDGALQEQFGVTSGPMTDLISQVSQPQPWLPDLTGSITLGGQAASLDLTSAQGAVPILVDGADLVTAAIQRVGEGVVWHLSTHHALTNALLRDPQHATLVPGLLRDLPVGSEIRFDTYHQMGAAAEQVTKVTNLQEWLYYTPWGWALLWLLGITALYLLLQGWRLGPPLPATTAVRRREAGEYVIAMANLLRRARRRDAVAQHHKTRLKRALGRLHQISPDLEDERFLERWAAVARPGEQPDVAQVRRLLTTLGQSTDEDQLVAAVQQIDQWSQRHR